MIEMMACENCSKSLGEYSHIKSNICKNCATKLVVKDLFFKTIFPITLAIFLLYMAYLPLHSVSEGKELYMQMLFFAGIPFGMKKMCFFIVPSGHEVAATAAILAINFIVGGIIGAFVLAWRMIYAVFNLLKSGVMLLNIARASA